VLNLTIDVIIPFHAVDNHLISSIKSVKESKGIKVRIIAVNDSGNLVSEQSIGLDSFDVLVTSFGKGYLDALATGVTQIDSTFVGFQDSDDFTDPWRFFHQVEFLQSGDFDLVTGQVIKTNLKGQRIANASILGKIPRSLSAQQKLIFGPHGADSSMVTKASVINETWHIHRRFSPAFADYGWLLAISPQLKIGHCHDAKYFYRSHEFQMSRKIKNSFEWNQLSKLWIRNFLDTLKIKNSNLAIMVQSTENYENVSLAIAFPSVLPVLTRMERLLLCDIISEMLVDFEFENVYEKKTFKNLLYIRGFLATRATKILYWPQALPIFYRAFISNLIGIKPRNNR